MEVEKKEKVQGEGEQCVDKDKYAFLPGDVIQPYTKPFIKVLYFGERQERCNTCFELTETLSRCACCKKVYYCGKKCQKKDWKNGHSLECKSELFKNPIKEMGHIMVDTNLILQILRTVAFLHLNPEKAALAHEMYDGSTKSFNDLMSNQKYFEKKEIFLELFHILAQKMGEDEGFKVAKVDVKYLTKLFGIWQTNAFEITDDSLLQTPIIGSAVYVEISFFDHSCRPNAVRVSKFPACALEVRCIHTISKGEKPFVTYLAGNRTRDMRKRVLHQRYNFTCHCELCEAEISGPLTDYKAFNLEKEKLLTMQIMTSWSKTFKHLKIVRSYSLKLYHEYDERLTNHYVSSFNIHYNKAQDVSAKEFVDYIKDLEKRIRITFGAQHAEYTRFFKEVDGYIDPFNIQFDSKY